MRKFGLVAMGGTFDVLHAGHKALLSEAFSNSSFVIIGLTSDELIAKKKKTISRTFSQRNRALKVFIGNMFPGKRFAISPLYDDFGPAVLEPGVDALIVSEETAHQGERLNRMRARKRLPPVEIVVVPMVLAEDGKRISSTRIRNSEIRPSGKLL
jgi:pantetheine-phosphate adenylyltransferase